MDYTFKDEEEAARRKTWLGALAVACAIVVGVVLLLRAHHNAAQPERAEDKPATVQETTRPELPKTNAASVMASNDNTSKPQSSVSQDTPPSVVSHTSSLPPPAPMPANLPAAGKTARALLAQGQDAERSDDLAAARDAYERALASSDIGDAKPLVESRLGAVMVALVTSQREMPEKTEHAIVSGDRIDKIAKSNGTTTELIAKANGISNPNNIRLGDRLRILHNAKFEILVSKSQNWLLLTMNGKFFKRYTVGTGRFNRTPVGTFIISDKVKEPSWWKDNVEIPYGDERNILGTRWMAISATGSTPPASGYGIHGTWDNSSLGQQSSAGCVRMMNSDVEELFMIVPKGTPVKIID